MDEDAPRRRRKVKKAKKKRPVQDSDPISEQEYEEKMRRRAARKAQEAELRNQAEDVDSDKAAELQAAAEQEERARREQEERRRRRAARKAREAEERALAEAEAQRARAEAEAQRARAEAKDEADDKDEDEYGDDFEDYDDDFEDEPNESAPAEAKQVDKSEGPIQLTNKLRPGTRATRPVAKMGRQGSAGVFSSVARRERKPAASDDVEVEEMGVRIGGASRRGKRVHDLLEILTLETERIDVFEMHSLAPWDFYIRNVGGGGIQRQAFSQTNEDAREMEVQTEPIESAERGANFPDDRASSTQDGASPDNFVLSTSASESLRRASQTCEILLEENLTEYARSFAEPRSRGDSNVLSAATMQLGTPDWLRGSTVIHLAFSDSQPHVMVSAHFLGPRSDTVSKEAERDKVHSFRGLLCVWDLHDSASPTAVLVSPGRLTCCCLSPGRPYLALAGLAEGSVNLWDLREDAIQIDAFGGEVHHATYSTDAIGSPDKSHTSSICDIRLLVSATGRHTTGSRNSRFLTRGTSERSSFQLATLDDRAVVHVWTVVELRAREPGVDASDLGLGIGGRVKLIHVAQIRGDSAALRLKPELPPTGPCALALDFFPCDPSQIFVAASSGRVWRCCRFGEAEPPRLYEPGAAVGGLGSLLPCNCSARSLHFSPFLPRFFLVGLSNGNINICKVEASLPLATWELTTAASTVVSEGNAGVHTVRWSPSRPAVFFVLDDFNVLHVWDLMQDEQGPILSEKLGESDGHSLFCLSGDAVTTRQPSIAFLRTSGEIEVNDLSQHLARARDDELAETEALLLRLM